MNTPSKIFIAYSRKDVEFLDELRAHLTPLERSNRIKVWYDGKIEAGREWDASIKEALYSADIILLLVSADSISSEYFYGNEVKISLERHHKRQARVIPVVLRPCAWEDTPLAELQALPKDGKAVTDWPSRDNAYADVVKTISHLLKEKSQVASPMTVEKSSAPHAEIVAEQPQDRPQTRPIWRRPTFLVGSLSGVVIATVLAVITFGLGGGKDGVDPKPDPKDSLKIASSTQMPNRFQAFLGSADSLFRLTKFDLASDLYDSALVVQPDSYKATEGKRKSQEALNTQDKSQRYQAVLREAERLYSISNYSSALAQFQKAATLLPDEPSAKAGISKCNTAIKTAEAKAKKQKFEGLLADAIALQKNQKYAEAKLKYEEAKRLFPTDPRVSKGLADCEKALNTAPKRPLVVDRTLKIDPNVLTRMEKISALEVSIKTGNDDLRSDSEAYFVVGIKGKSRKEYLLNKNRASFSNGEDSKIKISLEREIQLSDINYLGLHFKPKVVSAFGAGDNWHVYQIDVISGTRNILSKEINKRFTSSNSTWGENVSL